MDQEYLNYNDMSLEELIEIRSDLSNNINISKEELNNLDKIIENKFNLSKPQSIELGVNSISSEEVVKYG